ncbi:MAG TPA: dynamin family protein, partial [Chthonomonadaceae bacterium]|nr:dynamin family protein [Chthonomonadaceae bacterium]
MNNSAFDLDGLTPQRETTPRPARAPVPEYDLTPKAAPAKAPGPADFDLPPVDMRAAWDLQVLLHKEPVPAAPYNAWLRELRALANEAAGRDAEVHDALAPLVDVQATPFATVAFGGHFKTGKSTLLNAALGRRVLPAADLPETGAICVLKSGSVDGVEVFAGGRRRTVPCTLEAIQQEVSLIGEVGERRESVHRVEQLEITLAGCGIPADALWIDSPGINDTDEMNACALRAARRADVLVWVLSSRQPLSEVEMSFLADHIAERGATGVVFVLNAFLPDNTATAWETFLTKKAPWIRDKVLYHAPELGFTEDAPPLIAPVCGLGLYGDSQNDFGRTELRRLLLGLGSPEVPRVRRARLSRVALALRAVAHAQDERRQRERVAYDAMAKAAAEAKRESQRARSDFSGAAGDALERFYGQWAVGARNGAT